MAAELKVQTGGRHDLQLTLRSLTGAETNTAKPPSPAVSAQAENREKISLQAIYLLSVCNVRSKTTMQHVFYIHIKSLYVHGSFMKLRLSSTFCGCLPAHLCCCGLPSGAAVWSDRSGVLEETSLSGGKWLPSWASDWLGSLKHVSLPSVRCAPMAVFSAPCLCLSAGSHLFLLLKRC